MPSVDAATVALAVGPACVVATAASVTAVLLQRQRLKHEREINDEKLRNERRVADITEVRRTLVQGVEIARDVAVWVEHYFTKMNVARQAGERLNWAVTEPGQALLDRWQPYVAELEVLFGPETEVYETAMAILDLIGPFNFRGRTYGKGADDVDLVAMRDELAGLVGRWREIARSLAGATT